VDFGDSSIIYEMRFWMRSAKLYNQTCDEIRSKLWYELHRRNIRIPFPIRTLEMRSPNAPKRLVDADNDAAAILRDHTCMRCLTEKQAQDLAASASRRLFAHGEVMMREGEDGDSMQVILDGEADVFLKYPKESGRSGSEKVAALGRGDYFGEMSLMTGDPRSATVRARGDVLTMEIEKAQLVPVFEDHPELLESLGELLAQRQQHLAELMEHNNEESESDTQKESVSSARLLQRIRAFFGH
jgi:CRP-like cAMP-binding protein